MQPFLILVFHDGNWWYAWHSDGLLHFCAYPRVLKVLAKLYFLWCSFHMSFLLHCWWVISITYLSKKFDYYYNKKKKFPHRIRFEVQLWRVQWLESHITYNLIGQRFWDLAYGAMQHLKYFIHLVSHVIHWSPSLHTVM